MSEEETRASKAQEEGVAIIFEWVRFGWLRRTEIGRGRAVRPAWRTHEKCSQNNPVYFSKVGDIMYFPAYPPALSNKGRNQYLIYT
jgi:hypothetical protein